MMSVVLTASTVAAAAMEASCFSLSRALHVSRASSCSSSGASKRFTARLTTGLNLRVGDSSSHNHGYRCDSVSANFGNLAGEGEGFCRPFHLPSSELVSKCVGSSKFLLTSRGDRSCCRAKNDFFGDHETEDEEALIQPRWPVLERWDVPWDAKTTSLGMVAWLLSFLLTGLLVSVVAAQFGIGRRQYMSLDDQAVYILIHQLAQTIAGLSIINFAVNKYKPLPAGLFQFDLKSPFNLERGWLLWALFGLLCSGAAVVAASYISAAINGQPPARDDTDALVQLLPIIGASPLSTASLIGVTGVLAPLLEETVFRGFLMTSLTKWLPTPAAVVVSACAFAGAHLTPGEFPQLFALGIILGFSYAQTRNLACPMLIHCIWNSGVVVVLTLLRLQGFDIQELL